MWIPWFISDIVLVQAEFLSKTINLSKVTGDLFTIVTSLNNPPLLQQA